MKYINIKLVISSLILAFVFGSCSEFDDINKNPNTPTNVTAEMLARSGIINMTRKAGGDKNFTWDQMLAKYFTWTEVAEDYVFNKIGTESVNYDQIPNGRMMVEYAADIDKDAYSGLALVLQTHQIYYTTMKLGDVPYSEMGKAEEGTTKPKYDPQKDVMLGLLKDLDDAHAYFTKATRKFAGDPLFGGDLTSWKKITTALQLKILTSLSKKESDTDLNIKTRFKNAVDNMTLMTSNKDNLQLVYEDKASMYYPYSKINSTQTKGPALSTTLVDTLKRYKDYRLFYYAEPAGYQIKQGLKEDDFDAYMGIDISLKYSDQSDLMKTDKMCYIGNRYVLNNAGEPVMKLGYAEQQFILAEGALRGWITGDPGAYYKKGIEAAMNFVASNTLAGQGYEHGRPITQTYINDYLNQSEIQLSGSFEDKLNKIITQKYLASFLQFHWDPYFEYRRTGYPKFPINPESSLNDSDFKNQVPTRWRYGQTEYNTNRENLEVALERQFGGQDNNNGVMWILK